MFETFKLIDKFYRTEAKPGQYGHKLATYFYYSLFEGLSRIIGRNRTKYFLRHITGLAFRKMRVQLKDGLIINHFLENVGIICDVLVLDEYKIKSMKKHLTAVDVGANIGITALLLAKRCRADRVICFEPCKDNYELLELNIRENKCDNVVLAKKGMLDKPGKIKLYHNGSATHSVFVNKYSKGFEMIDLTTLDNECKAFGNIDFLKVDVEGPELKILYGGAKTLPRVDRVAVERTEHTDEKELTDFLRKSGFTVDKDYKVSDLFFAQRNQ